jgi:ribonuclease R
VWPPQRRESAREAIEGLMRERGLARGFEGAVERAAGKARAGGGEESDGGPVRRDLRELATFTIDPAAARDFDDAISAEWIEGGGAVRVWVHIADVSSFVREGSPVDVEARLRGTSVYVPGAVEPMLPHALSGDACSLVPGRERLAVTVEMQIPVEGAAPVEGSAAGRRAAAGRSRRGGSREASGSREAAGSGEARLYRSLIRSDERLDYDRVDRVFAGVEAAVEPWGEPLAAARAAARALGEARAAQAGALTLDSAEPEFEFDERGEVRAIVARAQTESHRLIEHLMIAANEAVARWLERHGTPCLYRVHERPLAESVERLVAQLATLDVPTPPVPDGLSRAQAAELVGEISRRVEEHVRRTAARAQAGDGGVSPTGGRRALSSLVLRALRQAYYTPVNLGHAGLGSDCYCHFTSPIRRYPDLVCHRALLSSLGHAERAPHAGGLEELGQWCSERERAAMVIERDADDVARCFALERALYGEDAERSFAGEVVGLISAGAFVAFGGGLAAGGDLAPVSGGDRVAADRAAAAEERAAFDYEGMLPVRRLVLAAVAREGDGGRGVRDENPAQGGGARGGAVRGGRHGRRPSGGGRAGGGPAGGERREWWELNEEGTILRGERSGATLRLGDPIVVRVERVDAARGRVDLSPGAPEDTARRASSGGGAARRAAGSSAQRSGSSQRSGSGSAQPPGSSRHSGSDSAQPPGSSQRAGAGRKGSRRRRAG